MVIAIGKCGDIHRHPTAATHVRKWRKAKTGATESAQVLEYMERSSTEEQLQEWRDAEAEALAMRTETISAMDIFDVKMKKGEK